MSEDLTASEFTRLLEYLKASRGFDFGAYKVSSLMRRIQKRMQRGRGPALHRVHGLPRGPPDEFGPLFDTILINVTSFFRDPPAWEYLRREDPAADPARSRRRTSRSASGAPAAPRARRRTRLAMLLAEALGEEEFRQRVKIYATDVDEEALATARQGSYDARQVAGVPPELLDKYFETTGEPVRLPQRPAALPDLRPPRPDPGRPDLAPRPAGLPQHPDVLQRRDPGADPGPLPLRPQPERLPVPGQGRDAADPRQQLPAGGPEAPGLPRTPTANLRDRLLALARRRAPADPNGVGARHLRLREAAFDAGPVAQIVVDRRGYLVAGQREGARGSSAWAPATSAACSRTWRSPTGRWSCAPTSRRPTRRARPVIVKDVEWRGAGSGRGPPARGAGRAAARRQGDGPRARASPSST